MQLRRIVGLDPVREQHRQIEQRVGSHSHVPIDDGDRFDPFDVHKHVVKFEVPWMSEVANSLGASRLRRSMSALATAGGVPS
jgi:hypothetical protein